MGAVLLALFFAAQAGTAFAGWYVTSTAERALPGTVGLDDDEADDEDDAPEPFGLSHANAARVDRARERRDSELMAVFERNPFCPTCTPEPAAEGGSGVAPEDLALVPGEVESSLPLVLVATMEARPPGRSLATIVMTGQEKAPTGIFAEGDVILPNVSLLRIENGVVHLQSSGRLEYLRVRQSGEPSAPPRAAAQTPEGSEQAGRPRSSAELDGARDAIQCAGEGACAVERAFVEDLLKNPATLVTQGNAAPYNVRGLRGFRLSRVRDGTLPQLLGLRTGDVITAINGQELTNLQAAMGLYSQLRNASNLSVEYTRNVGGTRHQKRLDVTIN